MNERTHFFRKVAYGVAIAVLLFPLSLLSSPATVDSEGGTLAQLRSEYRLGQGDLGEIDPASETIKLATLGLRGLAVNLLWEKATHYKKVEDWTNLAVTLEQLAKLQPNFITFWKYQSWNLSYNVSVEFDDYHDRYYWVRRGIQFLEQGEKYNRDNPELLAELGWVNGQKIGRSDEKKQYRRLYKADDDFHPVDRPPVERDNWLVGKNWYLKSIAAVDEKGRSLGRKSPAIFYSTPSKSQMSYSAAIEDEGLFERAVAGWKKGGKEWSDFGRVPIEHSTGPILYLGDEEKLAKRVEELREQLTSLLDGVEEKVASEALAKLTDEQREALDTPYDKITEEQRELAYEARQQIKVTPELLAEKIAEDLPEKQREAEVLAADLRDTSRLLQFTQNYKSTTNYDYWALRCEFEQTRAAMTARELVYRARREFMDKAAPVTAKEIYEEAFARWKEVFEEFPDLMDVGGTTGDDIMVFVYEYNEVLEQLDEQIADDFPLWDLIENFDTERVFQVELHNREQKQGDGDEKEAAEGTPAGEPENDPEADAATAVPALP